MIKVNYDATTGKVIGFGKDIVPYIEITEEERKRPLPDKYSYYAVENGKFVIARREPTPEEQEADRVAAIDTELAEIQQWLCDNDWKVNKIVIGEWEATDARWVAYLEERAIKRARHDELKGVN